MTIHIYKGEIQEAVFRYLNEKYGIDKKTMKTTYHYDAPEEMRIRIQPIDSNEIEESEVDKQINRSCVSQSEGKI